MSGAKFYLVPRASILASGDSDDFHHVAPDALGELVLVAVEAFDRVTRERDEALAKPRTVAEHLMSSYERVLLRRAEKAERERDEAQAEAERLRADHDFEYRACEVARADAARLREALVESREAQHKASLERDAHHREEVVLRAEVERLRGLIAEAEYADHSPDGNSCPWCSYPVKEEGHSEKCPAFSARGEVRR